MAVMSSPRNRCRLGVDNPIDDDGFWEFRKFKAKRRSGAPTGGRLWRRTLRTREQREVRAEIDQYFADQEAEIREMILADEAWLSDFSEESFYAPIECVDGPEDTEFWDGLGCNDDCPSCLDEAGDLYAERLYEFDYQDRFFGDLP